MRRSLSTGMCCPAKMHCSGFWTYSCSLPRSTPMSTPVAIERLRNETLRFTFAPYLITVTDDAHPHAVAVDVTWERDTLAMNVGKRSARNSSAHPLVSLLWPPNEPGGYSLIVDGTAAFTNGGDRIAVTPTRAVLHRPATSPDATKPGCTADCDPILG